jgi:hypothetical protein
VPQPDQQTISSATGPPYSKIRKAGAALGGAEAYVATLYRFLSYSERNHMDGRNYLVFALATLFIGFVATLGTGRGRYGIAMWVPIGVFIAHSVVIAGDWRVDPSDHNLLPFEFIVLGICAAPAFIGAFAASMAEALKR